MFSPVTTIVDGQRLYRTPLRKVEDDVTMWVGDGMVRYYQTHSLPTPVKVKLAMVMAYDGASVIRDDVALLLSKIAIYENTYPEEFNDIGWRASTTFFCIVLEDEILREIRGDSGSKSKEESKRDTEETGSVFSDDGNRRLW